MIYTLRQNQDRAPDIDGELMKLADQVHLALAGVVGETWVPDIEVELIWTRDFIATVQEMLDMTSENDEPEPRYDVERLGGMAVAKNIPMSKDSSHVAVVMNCDVLGTPSSELIASSIFLLAHELTHPIITRMRAASGVLTGVQLPSHTPTECARSISREAMDEYWADRIASIIIGAFGTAEKDGEQIPLHQGHVMGGIEGYRNQLAQVLDSHIFPSWPNLIQDYREHRVDLQSMWGRLVTDTNQIMTLLAHGQACEDSGPDDNPPLVDDVVANHRGFNLYIEPVWTTVLEAIGDIPLTLSRDAFISDDLAMAEAGETALKTMWELLGLTFNEYDGDRKFHIHVDAPTW